MEKRGVITERDTPHEPGKKTQDELERSVPTELQKAAQDRTARKPAQDEA